MTVIEQIHAAIDQYVEANGARPACLYYSLPLWLRVEAALRAEKLSVFEFDQRQAKWPIVGRLLGIRVEVVGLEQL